MLAAIVTAADRPWEIQDLAIPVPGPDQVLIEIHASGLCFTDVHQASGHFGMAYPMRLGHEPVGEIVAVGAAVTTRRVGDRVGVPWHQRGCGRCEWCQRNQPERCPNAVQTAITLPGAHAQYMLAYDDGTVLLPEGISYEQAAPVFCAGYTVYSGLRAANPQPHETIAVVGIGGLGHLAVQYAKAAGFRTYAVTGSKDKVELVKQLGADEVFADADALAKAGGADIVLSASNSNDATASMIGALRTDGRLVVMGVDSTPLQLSGIDLLSGRKSVIGASQNGRTYLYEALDYVARGKVRVVAETFALSDINAAYDRVRSGDVRFRAVILPRERS